MHRNNLVNITEDISPGVILRTGALVVALCAAFAGWLLSNAYVEWAVLWEGQLRIVHTLVARFVFAASFCISCLVLNFFASVLLDAMDAMFLLYAIDRDHRIYVGDRTNNRIQVFTEEGEFIEDWPDVSDPVGVFIDESESVWVISARLNRLLKYNTQGELQYYVGAFGGTRGGFAGGLDRPHQMDVDQEGNLYIASWDGGWMDKFVPKPGADPGKLVGRALILDR